MRKSWDGWRATGATLFLRPNTMLSAHNLPFYAARQLGDELSRCHTHGMVGDVLDSLTGQWSTQGPNLYVVGRFHTRPDWPVSRILAEYYAGFGTAAKSVRAYFSHWEKLAERFSKEASGGNRETGFVAEKDDGTRLGYRNPLWALARRMYTPAAMAEGRSLIEAAQRAARGDTVAEQRVAFLERGLDHAELTMEAARAHADHQQNSGKPISDIYADNYNEALGERYRSALDRLVEFRKRAALECPNISNVGWMTFQEWAVGWAHLKPWDPKTPGRYRSEPKPRNDGP
jgi:hypothetical protein